MAEGGGLATLIVTITADASDFLEGLKQCSDASKAFAEAGAVMAGAGTAILGSMAAMTEQAGSYAAQIEIMSQRTGLSTESVSALGMAATATGGDLDSVSAGIRKLTTDAENAASGNQKMVDLFQSLGVSVFDVTGHVKDMNTLLPQVAQAISQIPNPTQQAADAIQLFGRGGLALLPMLQQGAAGMDAWAQKAADTGHLVSDAEGEQAHAFEMAQEQTEAALSGISMTIGRTFLPAMTDMANAITTHLVSVRQWVAAYPDVTEAVAGLGLVLGTGGVLALGIAGLTAGIPFLIKGMNSLAEGVQAVGTAIGVAEGTVETLTAGFLAATAGAVALGAGIGIAVGALADWAIKGTPVQTWLDSFTAKIQAQSMYQGDMLATTQKAADVLQNQYGVSIQQGTMSIEKWNQSVTDSLRAHQQLDPVLQQEISDNKANAEATQKYYSILSDARAGMLTQMQTEEAQYASNAAAAKKFQQQVDAMVNSVKGAGDQANVLETSLAKLESQGVSETEILKKLGPTIDGVTDSLQSQGRAIQYYTQHFLDLQSANLDVKIALQNFITEAQGVTVVFNNQMGIMTQLGTQSTTVVQGLTRTWEDHYNAVIAMLGRVTSAEQDEANQRVDLINQEITADTTYASKFQDLTLASQQMKMASEDALRQYHDLVLGYMNASDDGYDADTLARIKDLATNQLNVWNTYGVEYKKLGDDLNKTQIQHINEFQTSTEQAAENMQKAEADAMASLSKGIADGLATDLVHWQNFGDTLTKLAQDTAQKMLSAFLEGLLNPLTNALKSIGQSIAGALSSAIGGIGGLGGSAAGSAAGSLDTFSLGEGGAGAGALGGISLSTLGIGAAVAAGAYAVDKLWKSTQAHPTADQFVQQIQNPFGSEWISGFNSFQGAFTTGSLSIADAENQVAQMQSMWAEFNQQAETFAQQGSKQALVVGQAMQTLSFIPNEINQLVAEVATVRNPIVPGATVQADPAYLNLLAGLGVPAPGFGSTSAAAVPLSPTVAPASQDQANQQITLLNQILQAVGSGGNVYLDSTKVGSVLYKSSRFGGVQLVGAQ